MVGRIVKKLRSKLNSLGKTKLNSLYLASAQYIISFLGAIKGIVLAKILGPTLLGEVAAVTLIHSYGASLRLGTIEAMNRNVPYYRSKGETQHAENTKNSAFTFSLINGTLAATALIIFALTANLSPFYRFGFIVYGLSIPTYFIYIFQLCLYRYQYNFLPFAVFQVLQSVFAVAIAIAGCFFISNYAVVLGFFISHWIVILIYWLRKEERFSLYIDKRALLELLKLGLPLFSIYFFNILITTVDRVVILNFMDSTQLGLYTLPLSMAAYYSMLGRMVNQVVFQKMVSEYGKNQDRTILSRTVQKSVIILVLTSPIIGYVLDGAIRLLIDVFLPKYTPSKALVAIFIMPAFFKSVAPFYESALITLAKPIMILRNQIILVVSIIALNLFLVGSLDFGIEGVAYAITAGYILYFILQFYSFYRCKGGELGKLKYQPIMMMALLGIILLVRHLSLKLAYMLCPNMFSSIIYIIIAVLVYGVLMIYILKILKKKKVI